MFSFLKRKKINNKLKLGFVTELTCFRKIVDNGNMFLNTRRCCQLADIELPKICASVLSFPWGQNSKMVQYIPTISYSGFKRFPRCPQELPIQMESWSRLAAPGVRAGCVRDPFGVRSGSVRGPFGIVRDPFGIRWDSVRVPFGFRKRILTTAS